MNKFCDPSTPLGLRIRTLGRARRAAAPARRADRFPRFFGLRRDAGAALDALKVLIVGVGSVGATTALSLARLHIGRLCLVDRGRFKPISLLTQPVGPAGIGRPKAIHIAERCRVLSPQTRCHAFACSFQELPLAVVAEADFVVLAGDNLTVARDVGQRCLQLGVPLLHCAVHGDTLTAQCRLFGMRRSGPCPACLFGASELRMLEEEHVWSCEGFRHPPGAEISSRGREATPTLSIRPLCGIAGEMAALSVVRWALGLGEPALDTMTEWCGYTCRSFVTPLRRRAHCCCRHERWRVERVAGALADRTPEALARAARPGADRDPPRSSRHERSIALGGFRWVEQARCRCPQPQPVHRFVPWGAPVRPRCPRCGAPLHAQPFFTHEAVPLKLLGDLARRPLRRLGSAAAGEAIVRVGAQTTLWYGGLPLGGAR